MQIVRASTKGYFLGIVIGLVILSLVKRLFPGCDPMGEHLVVSSFTVWLFGQFLQVYPD